MLNRLAIFWQGIQANNNTQASISVCPNDIMLRKLNNKGDTQVNLNLQPRLSSPEKRIVASQLIKFLWWVSGYSLNHWPSYYKQPRSDFPHTARPSDFHALSPGCCHLCACDVPHCIMLLPGAFPLSGNQLTPGKGANQAGVALGWKLWAEGRVCTHIFKDSSSLKGIVHKRGGPMRPIYQSRKHNSGRK